MQRRIRRVILPALVLLAGAAVIAASFSVCRHQANTDALVRYHPARQPNTIWTTAENDILFITGDDGEADPFRAFARWNGTYVEAELYCDYGQNAELSIPADESRGTPGDVCLVFGKFQIAPDRFSIKVEKERSAPEFVGDGGTIVLQRSFTEDLEEGSALDQLVSDLTGT